MMLLGLIWAAFAPLLLVVAVLIVRRLLSSRLAGNRALPAAVAIVRDTLPEAMSSTAICAKLRCTSIPIDLTGVLLSCMVEELTGPKTTETDSRSQRSRVSRWGGARIPVQAGIAVYERDDDRLVAARIYDDVCPPVRA